MMATRQRDRGYGDSSPSSYELHEPEFFTGLRLKHSHERLVDWRRIAAEARSILLIAAHLRRGIPTQVNHWVDGRGLFLHDSQVATRSPDIQKWILSLALVGWTNFSGRLVTDWQVESDRPTFRWELNGTGGVSGAQLLKAVTSDSELSVYSECGSPYSPKRQPNPNRENFWPACSAGSNRAAKRRSTRRRMRRIDNAV